MSLRAWLVLGVGLLLLNIVATSGVLMWNRHTQQHATYEQQIKELQAVVNALLQERNARR